MVFVFVGGGSFGVIEVGMLCELVVLGVVFDMVVGVLVGVINVVFFVCYLYVVGMVQFEVLWCGVWCVDVMLWFWWVMFSMLGILGG